MKRNKDFIIHTQSPVEEPRHVPERAKGAASALLQGTRARNPKAGVCTDTPSFSACASKACPGQVPAVRPALGMRQRHWSSQDGAPSSSLWGDDASCTQTQPFASSLTSAWL